MSDRIEYQGKVYYEQGYLVLTNRTSEARGEEIKKFQSLNSRAMAIIADAIMHGIPVTEEVADVRNQIVFYESKRGVGVSDHTGEF